VEFVDGSIIAQLGPPDMRLPIQYALTFPHRRAGVAHRLDWSQTYRLELIPPDLERHDALRLGFEVARQGGSAGAVLNAANEAAVNAFLQGTIGFPAIVRLCRTVLEAHAWEPWPSLERLAEWDLWARAEVARRLP
jgi:1-deoxy-D-xylulose-5-phosphate reductoisomerase